MLPGTEVANLNAHSDACGYAEVLRHLVESTRRNDFSFIIQLNCTADLPQSARSVPVILGRLRISDNYFQVLAILHLALMAKSNSH